MRLVAGALVAEASAHLQCQEPEEVIEVDMEGAMEEVMAEATVVVELDSHSFFQFSDSAEVDFLAF